jgi:hypothetical protein
MFEKEHQFYETHRAEYRGKYAGKHIVISGQTFLGAFDTATDAYREAIKTFKPGEFMIKEVFDIPEEETVSLSPFVYG